MGTAQIGGIRLVEVFPFVRLSWRSDAIRREWETIRSRVYAAKSYAEYNMVKKGMRNCDVYQLDPDKFDMQVNRVFLDRLHYLSILRSKQYGGFGHRHYDTDTIDENTFIYGCVCDTLENAIKFHDAGVINLNQRIKSWLPNEMKADGIDHDVTGELLGYPKCDRDFFESVWLSGGCLDPMFEVAKNTEGAEIVDENTVNVGGNPYLNRLIRYFGFELIPFFPHSFDCKEAGKFGDNFFKVMAEYDKEATEKCYTILNMPMVWTLQNCITYIEHPLFIGSANGYDTPEKKTVRWLP
jgi:hypothetical protein